MAANRVNKHGLLFAWAGIYGLIQGVMGYMFLFPYFLAVGLIAELSMLGKDTYRNPLRTRIGWTINCVGNFVGCAVPLWWAWDSYTAMALESGFTSETLEMQMAMVTSPALMLLGADDLFEGRSPVLYIAAIALTALSNFLFFYMLSLIHI